MVLQDKRCYLGGPIENDPSVNHNWRTEPKKVLVGEFKIDLFDPFDDPKQIWVDPLKKARDEHDYETMARIAKMFVRKDLAMVDRADFVIGPHDRDKHGVVADRVAELIEIDPAARVDAQPGHDVALALLDLRQVAARDDHRVEALLPQRRGRQAYARGTAHAAAARGEHPDRVAVRPETLGHLEHRDRAGGVQQLESRENHDGDLASHGAGHSHVQWRESGVIARRASSRGAKRPACFKPPGKRHPADAG